MKILLGLMMIFAINVQAQTQASNEITLEEAREIACPAMTKYSEYAAKRCKTGPVRMERLPDGRFLFGDEYVDAQTKDKYLIYVAVNPRNKAIQSSRSYPWYEPTYLGLNPIDFLRMVTPPPEEDSAIAQKDLAEVLELQKTRTKEDCYRSNSEYINEFGSFFGPPYGPLTEQEVRIVSDFFDTIKDDAKYYGDHLKNLFARSRPFVVSQDVTTCTPKNPKSTIFGYPSGHTLVAFLDAGILALIDPSREKEFYARAEQFATGKLLAGVHFPLDLAGSKELVAILLPELVKNPKVQNEIERLKALLAR